MSDELEHEAQPQAPVHRVEVTAIRVPEPVEAILELPEPVTIVDKEGNKIEMDSNGITITPAPASAPGEEVYVHVVNATNRPFRFQTAEHFIYFEPHETIGVLLSTWEFWKREQGDNSDLTKILIDTGDRS